MRQLLVFVATQDKVSQFSISKNHGVSHITMEVHCSRLSTMCRTCGNKIVLSRKYSNPKAVYVYSDILLRVFNVDVSKDENFVHPKNICDTCRKRLDYCKKNPINLHPDRPLINFTSHTETGCLACTIRTSKFPPLSVHHVKSESAQVSENVNETLSFEISNELFDSKCKLYGFSNMTSSCNEQQDNFCALKFEYNNNIPETKYTVVIDKKGVWSVFFKNCNITNMIPLSATKGQCTNESDFDELFTFIKENNMCQGNDDYPEIIEKKMKIEEFIDREGSASAFIQTKDFCDIHKGVTIRHADCLKFIPNNSKRCSHCSDYRKILNTANWRMRNVKVDETSEKFTRNQYLTKEQLIGKAEKLTKEVKHLRRSVTNYEKLIAEVVDNEGEVVPEDLHKICADTMGKEKIEGIPEDSPQYLLWEQQKKQLSLKNAKNMKWHPLMLKWCVSIYLKSPGAYEHLRSSGFLCLPHKNTILKYANYTDPRCGLNIDVLKKLHEITKNYTETEKFIGIVFDEMKIKSGLIYSRHNGKIIGFTDVGDINNQLIDFKNRIENNNEHKPIATHMLTFMVKGICSALKFPVAYFAGQGFTSDQLYPCVWECIRTLEAMGFKVIFITSDGASPNRRFYRLHSLDDSINIANDGVIYWCWNRYTPPAERRKIYFICDVPHLIKTTRNNLERSYSSSKTRNLMINGHQISWAHIISLLEYDMGDTTSTPGLRQTKLTTEHVYLTPPSRMNVSLAAQVLSNSVAVCLASQNQPNTIETRRFISMFDKFFDCLNVKSQYEGLRRKKENLMPYGSPDDVRLKWLQNDFLQYLQTWQDEANSINELSKEEQRKLCLSQQTLEGLRITVHSFVEIVPLMLNAGASYILSDKLNQDCLEEHFGKQRMKGGSRENPTVQDYQYTEMKLQVGASSVLKVMRGNTRGKAGENSKELLSEDTAPLSKRTKKL